jgi:hypothetical protein
MNDESEQHTDKREIMQLKTKTSGRRRKEVVEMRQQKRGTVFTERCDP